MGILRRHRPTLGVVVPVYGVADYLPACLDSLLAQSWRELDVVVVDDGSPDHSGDIARSYAARDPRVRVVRTENHGLGAARNTGLALLDTAFIAFLDSDDVLPPDAYSVLLRSLLRSRADFAVGNVARWEEGRLDVPPWMRRLHRTNRRGISADDHPEILGDVFAWNKVFRTPFFRDAVGGWPTGVRYEDQPAMTAAYLRGRFDVREEVVYHWRIRTDGSSITQQRSSLRDLEDRTVTKRRTAELVATEGTASVQAMFHARVLPGDLHRYFREIPGCSDAWWELLRRMVEEFWGERSLTQCEIPPAQRLLGWLVEHGRREEAAHVAAYLAGHDGPLPRVDEGSGRRLDVPGLDPASIDPVALRLRPHER
ncbi:glycosyltransferase family 2 protein [Nocardioides sp.]|uniref:glycosyltransferase family 2 protein n=1 Tax=Nocardioides sp. TaxID=35761 RepID=UPI002BF3E185|nr:glycosyltransferase family 2 protein [Nocardioides sp.]HSX66362.1 glycosyltransferase family 2 protein [Nocardioides sp.]